jgi:hypothetical protein
MLTVVFEGVCLQTLHQNETPLQQYVLKDGKMPN